MSRGPTGNPTEGPKASVRTRLPRTFLARPSQASWPHREPTENPHASVRMRPPNPLWYAPSHVSGPHMGAPPKARKPAFACAHRKH
eukprot:4494188-Pyramimonas_sp.AAC.1